MIKSPLKLKDYFVTDLSIKANPLPEGAQVQPEGEAGVTSAVESGQHVDNKRDWRVALKIKCEPIKKDIGGYSVTVELFGFFEVADNLPEEKIADVVSANAPAILYSAARELILLITGRGPYPAFSLPSASFIDETPTAKLRAAEAKKVADAQSKATAK